MKDMLKSEEGFTYIEVIGALVIFGLMFVFIVQLGHSVYELNRASSIENRMVHIAELEMENYKSGISNESAYLSITGMSRDSDIGTHSYSRNDLDGQYSMTLIDERTSLNIAEVTITIDANDSRVSPVTLKSQIIIDTE